MKKNRLLLSIVVVICCVAMTLIDGFWKPAYWLKSLLKVILFLSVPLIFSFLTKLSPGSVFKPDKKSFALGSLLGVGTFVIILAGYFLIKGFIDFSFIPGAIMENGGITADNFIYIALYIALCNSLLEEYFFRGFAFLTLKKIASPAFAYIFSAGAFAVYHAGMLDGWFSAGLFILTLIALFICGLFFNYLNHRHGRLWVSWLVHMSANLAINIIGMILLGIL